MASGAAKFGRSALICLAALMGGVAFSTAAIGLFGTRPLGLGADIIGAAILHGFFIAAFTTMGESGIEDAVKSVIVIIMGCVLAWSPKINSPALAVVVASSVITASLANLWIKRATS